MNPLPLPVRIAAGLVATAVEQVMELPRLVAELPVTAVSQALQASMRVQQKVTELAIKGDRALGALRPVEERPSWATFDDEEPPQRNGSVSELRPAATPVALPPTRRSASAEPTRRAAAISKPPPVGTEPVVPAAPTPATEVDGKPRPVPAAPDAAPAGPAATTVAATRAAGTAPKAAPAAGTAPSGGAAPAVAPDLGASDDASAPRALPDYPDLTIPQLRGKLRFLTVDDLRELLAWERANGARPQFVTMLVNRLATVTEA